MRVSFLNVYKRSWNNNNNSFVPMHMPESDYPPCACSKDLCTSSRQAGVAVNELLARVGVHVNHGTGAKGTFATRKGSALSTTCCTEPKARFAEPFERLSRALISVTPTDALDVRYYLVLDATPA